MAYGSNILKKEAAYYDLVNATIINGILHIRAGGSATQQLNASDISAITPNMCFTCISADVYSDRYEPDIQVVVYTKMTSDPFYTKAILYPILVDPNKYVCEFNMQEGTYDTMFVSISSDKEVSFTLWELCAEAADEEIETIIDGVKQSLPRLLYDYNTFPLSFTQAETTIAVITCRLLQNTDLQGHFLMSFSASQVTTLTLRFYDNESEELFAPLLYDIRIGYNSIGVPHAYMSRLAGIHTFVVTAQVDSGTCLIDTRRLLFTIDGGYLAIRELDIGMDVTDISIRQLATDNGPDQIWAIGLDAGEALIRYRPYKEENANVGWTAVGSLGNAIAAAIEFNGTWAFRLGARKYTIDTEEEPWYFWVTPDKILHACQGLPNNDASNIITLASNVISDVKAVRGYSSKTNIIQDQGLIVVYIKSNGKPYYRCFAYNEAAHDVVWENEVEIDVPANFYTFINVHRLNDYRVGIELSGPYGNKWLISSRTYVNQSVYPEIYDGLICEIDLNKGPQYFNQLPYTYTSPIPSVIDQGTDTETVENTYSVIEQHYFEYDYTNDVAQTDLGETTTFEATYGQPIRDQQGRLYVIINGVTTYVKKFEVEAWHTNTEEIYIFWFVLDHAIWADDAYEMFTRIAYNNSISYLSDVTFTILGNTTKIVISTTARPSGLVTTFTLKKATAYRLYDPECDVVESFYQDIVVTYDTTIYRNHSQTPETINSITSTALIDYIPVIYSYQNQTAESISTLNNSLQLSQIKVIDKFTNNDDSMSSLNSNTLTLEYTYVGDEPI